MNDFVNVNIIEIGVIKREKLTLFTQNKNCHVLSCRTNGSAIFETENKKFSVKCGDIFYIPEGISYSQKTDGEEVIYMHLEIFGKINSEFQQITSENPDYICETFKKIAKLWNDKGKNYKFYCASLLYSLIAETCIILPKEEKNTLSKAYDYINTQFSDTDFSISKACSLCNVSRAYFNRVFKKQNEITPVEYVNRLKTEKAKFLLLNGNYTHEEIAFLCGFNDVKYFYVVFKKITGQTTREYKNKEQSTN